MGVWAENEKCNKYIGKKSVDNGMLVHSHLQTNAQERS